MPWITRPWALAVCVGSACSSAGDRLALPDTTGSRSLLWGVHGAGAPRWFAIDLEAGFDAEALAVEVASDTTAEVFALAYAAPLTQLGFTPGPLQMGGEPLPAARSSRLFARSIAPDEVSPWTASAVWPEPVTALRVARRSPCGAFSTVGLPFDDHLVFTQAMLRFQGDLVIAAVSEERRGQPRMMQIVDTTITPLERLPLRRVHAFDDPWVAGSTAAVGGDVVIHAVDARGRIVDAAPRGVPAGVVPDALGHAGDVMYLLSDRGLDRWAQGAWSRVYSAAELVDEGTNGFVSVVSEDEVWFQSRNGSKLGWYRHGVDCEDGEPVCLFDLPVGVREPIDLDRDGDHDYAQVADPARTLAVHRELGPIVSTATSRYWALDAWPASASARVVELARRAGGHAAGVISPFPGGFLAAGTVGFLAEYHDGFGFCADFSLPELSVYQLLERDDGTWLASGVGPGSTPQDPTHATVYVVTWTRPE